mmetsp:Transcript_9285/g.14869  ORF Transcript_9285/g.14869 Transcript_9285/m.14869 type:complete len:154 (-) Transcript_9285:129-590(-)
MGATGRCGNCPCLEQLTLEPLCVKLPSASRTIQTHSSAYSDSIISSKFSAWASSPLALARLSILLQLLLMGNSNPTVAISSLLIPDQHLATASRAGPPLNKLSSRAEEDTRHLLLPEAKALLTRGKSKKRKSRNEEKHSSIGSNNELFLFGIC